MASLRIRKKGKHEIKPTIDALIAAGDTDGVIKKLTVRQKRFVEEYLVDFNASQAVIRAGYNPSEANRRKLGSELLDHPGVRVAIDVATAERADRSAIKPDYVIKKVMRTIEKAEADGSHNAVLKGCELLARHLGMFIERQEISGPNGDPIKYEQVKEAADGFTRAISSLIEREGPGEGIIVTNTGSEGTA
jgi:phage terminase small subunit